MVQGKVCVVTNGAKGIGRCVVEEFAKKGCTIAYMDMDGESGKRLSQYLRTDYGVDAFFFEGNICSEQDLEIFCGGIIGQYGKVDYLIHNTCINRKSFPEEKARSQEDFFLQAGAQALYFLDDRLEECFGLDACVVTIVSDKDSVFTDKKTFEKKSTLEQITKALAKKHGGAVRVNSVNPCVKQHNEQAGAAKPFDVAQTVSFLCEKKSDFINGENLSVDGSMTKMMLCKDKNGWSLLE